MGIRDALQHWFTMHETVSPLLRSHFSRAEFTASRNLFKIWPLAAIQFLLEDQSNVYVLELTGTMASSESRTSSTCKSSLVASLCDLGFALLFIAPFLVTGLRVCCRHRNAQQQDGQTMNACCWCEGSSCTKISHVVV